MIVWLSFPGVKKEKQAGVILTEGGERQRISGPLIQKVREPM